MKYGTPSGRTEECAICTDRVEVDERGRVPTHQRATGWQQVERDGRWTWETTGRSPDVCKGSERPSKQEKERRAATKAASLTEQAKAVRPEAAVTLDAMLEGRTDPDAARLFARIPEFRALALHAYARRFKSRKKVRTVWRFERYGDPHAGTSPRTRGDLYCRFCAELLMRNVRKSALNSERALPWAHLDRCMLLFLSGMRDAVPSTERVLPEEYRQEASDAA